jgi:outer membrane protein TolC
MRPQFPENTERRDSARNACVLTKMRPNYPDSKFVLTKNPPGWPNSAIVLNKTSPRRNRSRADQTSAPTNPGNLLTKKCRQRNSGPVLNKKAMAQKATIAQEIEAVLAKSAVVPVLPVVLTKNTRPPTLPVGARRIVIRHKLSQFFPPYQPMEKLRDGVDLRSASGCRLELIQMGGISVRISFSQQACAIVCVSLALVSHALVGCKTANLTQSPDPSVYPLLAEDGAPEIEEIALKSSDCKIARSSKCDKGKNEKSDIRTVQYEELVAPSPDVVLEDIGGIDAPRRIGDVLNPVADDFDPMVNTMEVDFSGALARVSGQNPQVAFASQRYAEAYARLKAAKILWLPSINAGISYNKHEGSLQIAPGQVFNTSRGSLQSGLGVRSVGTGSPMVPGLVAQFHMSDAVFQPKIANRAAAATQEAAKATTHDTLLDAALAYLRLLQAMQERVIAAETLATAQQLADLTANFAKSGQGAEADADRARAELVVRKNDVTRADESIKVSSARLNELMHMDPATILVPQDPTVVPIELVLQETPVCELLATGLSNRPELAEAQHLVCAAVQRYKREKFAPLLPSAFLGVSVSGYGGGLGSTIANFDDRLDLDAAVFWEVRNFGLGEGAARDEACARFQQARLRKVQVMDQVAREIMQAHAQVQSRHRQITVAEAGITAAENSYKRNMARIRDGEGLPIEVLQSIQALDQARREYLRTVVDYNDAQFRLHRALGWPIQ